MRSEHRKEETIFFCFQGYAYTFITEDQVRYAGDIIKALELSGSPVPPELEQLWASFKDQQKAVCCHLEAMLVSFHLCCIKRILILEMNPRLDFVLISQEESQ